MITEQYAGGVGEVKESVFQIEKTKPIETQRGKKKLSIPDKMKEVHITRKEEQNDVNVKLGL